MIRFAQKALLTSLFLLWIVAPTHASDAIAIWTGKVDESYHVFIGELTQNKWQKKPRSIYQSKNHLTTATIGSDSKGNLLAIWSMTLNDRMILMKSSFNGDKWSKPRPLGKSNSQNISATIVFDLEDNPWVFWVSDAEGLSDIYMTHRNRNVWSTTSKVNANNNVPDIFPLASLNKTGEVVVTWQAFSFESNSYESESRRYSPAIASKHELPLKAHEHAGRGELKDRVREISITNVPYSTGVTRVSVHYPKNLQLQSEFLNFRQ